MIVYCPVCQEPVRANEADVHGRCAACRGISNVLFEGVKYAVVGIELVDGEPAEGLKATTRRRLARGVRNYLQEAGNAVVDPLAMSSARALAEAQGFTIDHDAPAVHEHVSKMARSAGGEFTDAFETGCRPTRWEFPPCKHHSKKEEK